MMNIGRAMSFAPLNALQSESMMSLGGMGFDPIASGYANIAPMMSGVGFTIVNGQVTGMQQQFGSHMLNLAMPRNATFAVGDNNTVTETLVNGSATTMMEYVADSGSSSSYHLMSETMNFANPTTSLGGNRISGYAFSISNGAVTGMQEVLGTTAHSYTLNLPLLPTASFSVNGTTVTETLAQGNTIEIRSFVAAGSNGLYALASDAKTFIQPGTATTLLSIEPYERAKFTIDGSHAITQMQAVRTDGSVITVAPNSYTSFGQPEAGFVVETVTIGTFSSYEVYHDGNGDGVYTAVAHGTGATVDLIGLHAQLSSAAVEAVL